MDFGISVPNCVEGMAFPIPFAGHSDVVRVAQEAEQLGFDSILANDHWSTQNYVRSAFPDPPRYYEPLIMLAHIAAKTDTIRLVTGVIVLPLREPVLFAKQVATLDIQRRSSLSVLFIAHNVAVVRYLSDAVAVMHMGRIVEAAPAADFFAAPQHPYSRTLLDAVPQMAGPGGAAGAAGASAWTPVGEPSDPHEPPAGCRFNPRCPVGPAVVEDRDICRTLDPGADAAARPHRAACHFAGMLSAPPPPTAVISVTPGQER